MPANPEFHNRMVASALRSVEVAAKVRGWYHQFEDGHRHKTPDFDRLSTDGLELSIRKALGYGYPIEAVAGAASMSVDEVAAIAADDAA